MSSMHLPDVGWVDEVKAQPGSESIGMILIHRGVVRGTSRSGDLVDGMVLSVDRARLDGVLAEARTWRGIVAVRGWVNEGRLSVGDDIMAVLVAGDIRQNVFTALERLVSLIKTEVVSESEILSP
jgi:molybdopterin synthase catalytic subunit